MRFPIRFDPWWQPVLLVLGATPGNSYVAVDDTSVRVCFSLLRLTIPRARIARARRVPLPRPHSTARRPRPRVVRPCT